MWKLTSLFSLQEMPSIISKAFRTSLFLIIRTYGKSPKGVAQTRQIIILIKWQREQVKRLTIRLSWRISRETFNGRSFESTTPFTKLKYLGNWPESQFSIIRYQIYLVLNLIQTMKNDWLWRTYQFSIKVIWYEYTLNIQSDILGLPTISYVILPCSRNKKNWPEFYLTLCQIDQVLSLACEYVLCDHINGL